MARKCGIQVTVYLIIAITICLFVIVIGYKHRAVETINTIKWISELSVTVIMSYCSAVHRPLGRCRFMSYISISLQIRGDHEFVLEVLLVHTDV